MRKVLVITYYWPPSGGSGVQRWLKFCKYLREFGWEPIVYTPENPDVDLFDESLARDIHPGQVVVRQPIKEPRRLYRSMAGSGGREVEGVGGKVEGGGRPIDELIFAEPGSRSAKEKLLLWVRSNLLVPDARLFWVKPSIAFLSDYLRANPVDAIVSTGPPQSMHLIAQGIKNRLSIPWLADFRDPWTGIVYFDRLPLTGWGRRRHEHLERGVLENADSVVSVSDILTRKLSQLGAGNALTIPNGFDDEDLLAVDQRPPLDEQFVLSHVGLLTADRVPDKLWSAIAELKSSSADFARDIRVRFVGNVDERVFESARSHGVFDVVEQTGYLPHLEAVDQMRRSQVLLLIISEKDAGVVTGKVFEYMATGRPILMIGPVKGDAAAIVDGSGAGEVVGLRDGIGTVQVLSKMYERFKRGSLGSAERDIEQYGRRNLSRRMATELNRIADR